MNIEERKMYVLEANLQKLQPPVMTEENDECFKYSLGDWEERYHPYPQEIRITLTIPSAMFIPCFACSRLGQIVRARWIITDFRLVSFSNTIKITEYNKRLYRRCNNEFVWDLDDLYVYYLGECVALCNDCK